MSNFKEKKDKNVKECTWKKDIVAILEIERIKKEDKIYNLEKIKSE